MQVTPINLFGRLCETEKIELRGAGPDRVSYLANNGYMSSIPEGDHAHRVGVLTEVQKLCMAEFAQKSAETGFGLTWRY